MSFLIYVAENGTPFHIQNGKSNLDNIKETSAYNILVWASEKKDFDETLMQYYESLT
ncbi:MULTISPECIES: hypothetical protein [Chryseobacterium]|uniref:Uncharacterized protein n=1 Tax=Chryseobacterium gambrini TaxID=373672 RepID=A0A1N7LER5_9FLAO|nr:MULTISPECIES: hypothetical protein [Chryseobacterium]SIS72318.1 hypothetical protein SAMN05421785_102187 [Chryseobacterium gambrini]